MTITDFSPAVSEANIDAVERRIGRHFPSEYHAFLLNHNGGYVRPRGFRMRQQPGRVTPGQDIGQLVYSADLAWFYGVGTGDFYKDIEEIIADYKNRLPADLFPVGTDGADNQICVSMTGPDKDSVYYWDQDAGSDIAPSFENCYYVASSFNAFCDSLFSDE